MEIHYILIILYSCNFVKLQEYIPAILKYSFPDNLPIL